MSTKREMTGLANYTGHQIKSLRIGEMVSRRPEPRYATECTVCGSRGIETQARIRSGAARCLASGCGKEHLAEVLSDNPRRAREREEARQRAEQIEREERQAAELAATEQTLKDNANKIALTIRERIEKGKDDELFVSPELVGARMSREQATKFNAEQAAKFASEAPEYEQYRSDETVQALAAYFERNGIMIADAAMIRAAFFRLRDYGLLTRRADPMPEPAPHPIQKTVNLTIERKAEPEPSGPEKIIGRDDATGLPKEFTRLEIERMSSEQYRRAFPVFNTMAETIAAMRQQQA